jgi:ABC transporter substrate binding protein (PQQ-dependent alcohol dehydrogenase system)
MTTKAIAAVFVAWLVLSGIAVSTAAANDVVSFAYLQRENDPAYMRHRTYTGLILRDRRPPLDGAKTALRDSRVIGRSIGVKFDLRERVLGEDEDLMSAMKALIEEGTRVFLLDLPLQDVTQAARALTDQDVLLFNIRHGAGELRGQDCSPVLFHTTPSDAMLMDGLAQFLFKKNWTDVLVLEGEEEPDLTISAAFRKSAKKFNLNIVDVRPFVLSNDPRVRDQTNIAILTGDADYEVIFLADTLGEFGRYVPYQTFRPRPIVGSEGLRSSAWHWTWERHGAPQLNRRFDHIAMRRMKDADYAAWAAVKSVVEAMVRTQTRDVATLRDFLTSDAFMLDTYKGTSGNFRSWNNQLRQAVLLHTHNAVVARAPLDEFLHQTNTLDTLGQDRPETECRFE